MNKTIQTTALLLAAMASGYVGGLMSQASKPVGAQGAGVVVQDEVKAHRFTLVDEDNKLRATLEITPEDETLFLLKGTGDNDESIQLYAGGSTRAYFCGIEPTIDLDGEAASINLNGEKANLCFNNPKFDDNWNRVTRLQLGYTETVDTITGEKRQTYPLSTITMFDKAGKVIWQEAP